MLQEQKAGPASLHADELLDILKDGGRGQRDEAQSGVVSNEVSADMACGEIKCCFHISESLSPENQVTPRPLFLVLFFMCQLLGLMPRSLMW